MLARSLFLEVIDEMVREISQDCVDDCKGRLTAASHVAAEVLFAVTHHIARYCCCCCCFFVFVFFYFSLIVTNSLAVIARLFYVLVSVCLMLRWHSVYIYNDTVLTGRWGQKCWRMRKLA
jgi:hypothetical protein